MDFHYRNDNFLVVDITSEDGSLAGPALEEFIEEIVKLTRGKVRRVALDFNGIKYLNSAGLSDLIVVRDRFHEEELFLYLIGVSTNVLSLLEMVGFADFFTLVAHEGDLEQG